MSDPERLLEQGGGLAKVLLRAGCDERPSQKSFRRTLAAIGASTVVGSMTAEAAGGAGAVASGVAGSAAAKAGAGTISLVLAAKWLAIGGLGGLLTMGAASQLEGRRAPVSAWTSSGAATAAPGRADRPQHRVVVEMAAPSASERLDVPSPRGPATAPSAAGTVGARAAAPDRAAPLAREPVSPPELTTNRDLVSKPVAPVAPIALAAPAGDTPPQGSSSRLATEEQALRLSEEVRLIDGAWSAMKRQDHGEALRTLAGYESTYPGLALHPEVLFLRMAAEDGQGRIAPARAEANRIMALYPKSAQATRARELLAR